jgi:uncharacterized protein YyaL (SSP411 family)
MRRLPLAAVAVAIVLGGAASAAAADGVPKLPPPRTLVADRATFRTLAIGGLKQTRALFWNAQKGWYMGRSNGDPPVASTWSAFPFMELAAAVAIVSPTKTNRAFANRTFRAGEGYWDPTLGANGSGGVSWLWGLRNTGNAYFDDAGWWGVAYLDAYRATGKKRWLWDAGRALAWIDGFGWDKRSGGVWWDIGHSHKTSEPLAAAAKIAATLYDVTHRAYYLKIAKRYIGWADAKTRNPKQGSLYGRSASDGTVMDYVEGMMIDAHLQLCLATNDRSWCTRAEAIAAASLKEFPILASWAPETDVIYERALLDLYAVDHDPRWYAVAYANGMRARANSRAADGTWSLKWDGSYALPGTIYAQSATLQLFGWLASVKPPAS